MEAGDSTGIITAKEMALNFGQFYVIFRERSFLTFQINHTFNMKERQRAIDNASHMSKRISDSPSF